MSRKNRFFNHEIKVGKEGKVKRQIKPEKELQELDKVMEADTLPNKARRIIDILNGITNK